MAGQVIGYARCFAGDDEKTQHAALAALGVPVEHIYIDIGYTSKADRPALKRAISACRSGDVLMAISLDRLATSIRDLSKISETLAQSGATMAVDGLLFDPFTPAGHLMRTLASRFARFESDLTRARTIEGMAKARQQGRKFPGRKARLDDVQHRQLLADYESGEYDVKVLMEKYRLGRSALYAAISRERDMRSTATIKASAHREGTTR